MSEKFPKRRRWFQFRLRTLLIAVLVLSLPLSWLAVRMQKARRQREAVRVIEEAGGEVTYEPAKPSAPDWAREAFGDNFFVDVVEVSIFGPDFGDHEAAYLERLPKLWFLLFHDTQVTDAGIEHLKDLTHLRLLSIYGTHVTDTGLEHLKGLPSLQSLTLTGTEVTDAGLEHLKGLTNLVSLSLEETKITNAGLEHLTGLPRLRDLTVYKSNVTLEGVRKFQQALPNCKVYYATYPRSGVIEKLPQRPWWQLSPRTLLLGVLPLTFLLSWLAVRMHKVRCQRSATIEKRTPLHHDTPPPLSQ